MPTWCTAESDTARARRVCILAGRWRRHYEARGWNTTRMLEVAGRKARAGKVPPP